MLFIIRVKINVIAVFELYEGSDCQDRLSIKNAAGISDARSKHFDFELTFINSIVFLS